MSYTSLKIFLVWQSISVAFVLVIFGILLWRRELFRWTSAGFWAWAAFALYYFVNPLASVWWNPNRYYIRLAIAGGVEQGQWVSFVAIIGICAFFFAYLKTNFTPVTWNMTFTSWNGLAKLSFISIIGYSMYSLLTFRTNVFSSSNIQIDQGRFVGDVSGYQYVGHTFLFVPVVFLILLKYKGLEILGWALGGLYIFLSLSDPWARFTLVSMLLAMSLADTVRRQKQWPRLLFVAVAFTLVAVLQMRGHSSLSSQSQLYDLVKQIPDEIGGLLAANDSGMLATWYLESSVKEHITGYDYGIPLANYILFGSLPSRVFPQKYFLINWLRSIQPPVTNPIIIQLLYRDGAKSSLLGRFYANGNLIAVIVLAAIVGILSRKVDGMLAEQSHELVKATAISWMSLLWMIWGSSEIWGILRIGTIALPALIIWKINQLYLSHHEPSPNHSQHQDF